MTDPRDMEANDKRLDAETRLIDHEAMKQNEAATEAATAITEWSVVQINETHGRAGWIGAFVLVTHIKSWGVQGFVSMIKTHDNQGHAYIRLKWSEVDYIGRAVLVPTYPEEAAGAMLKAREATP